MSDDQTTDQKAPEMPTPSTEEVAAATLQKEWFELVSIAGQKQHEVVKLRRELLKINRRLRLLEKKATPIIASIQQKRAAQMKPAEVPPLKAVSE